MKLLMATENGAQELRVKVYVVKCGLDTLISLLLTLPSTSAQSLYFLSLVQVQGGTQQISEKIADRVGRDKIHLNQPITRITQENGIVTVETTTGKLFR